MLQKTPRLCLVVEDEPLLALDIETMLTEAGYLVAGPYASWREALQSVATHRPDAAIVDFLVQDGNSTELLRALDEALIPFAIYSGRDQASAPEFADAIWLEKPCMPEKLKSVMRALLEGRARGYQPGAKVGAPAAC